MPKEGEIFITSKGRRLIRSLEIHEADTGEGSWDDFYGSAFSDSVISRDYHIVTGDEDEPRYGKHKLVRFLKELREEGPLEYGDEPLRQDVEDWLIKNEYVKFISYNRSQSVEKRWDIDLT